MKDADSKNLALLEHCMDFLSCADKVKVEKVPFDDMPSHLMKDLTDGKEIEQGGG